MPTLYITEYQYIGRSAEAHEMQIPNEPPLATQTTTPDADGDLSSAFNSGTAFVRLCSDTAIKVGFGAAPVLADAGTYLPANVVEYFAVPPGYKLISATI